jgi:hypothetical protein
MTERGIGQRISEERVERNREGDRGVGRHRAPPRMVA